MIPTKISISYFYEKLQKISFTFFSKILNPDSVAVNKIEKFFDFELFELFRI